MRLFLIWLGSVLIVIISERTVRQCLSAPSTLSRGSLPVTAHTFPDGVDAHVHAHV
jgi:hypothetical protein